MMRMSRMAGAALLIAAAVATALWVLPARWVMAWIPDTSPIIVTDASGTLWSARATLAVGAPGLRRTLPDPLQWHLAFDGGPHLQVRHPWLGGPLDLGLSWRGAWVSAQSLQLPATVLTTAHALFNTLDPGGELHLRWPGLTWGWGAITSDGDKPLLLAQWRHASSSLTRVRPMGNYALAVTQATDRTLTLALKTEQGPLFLQGDGVVPASGRLRFDGKAWVDPAISPGERQAFQGLLAALGPHAAQTGEARLRIR